MSVTLSTGLRNAILATGFDPQFDSGVLEIRSGVRPASANTAPAGTALASIPLPADAFAAPSGGSSAKAGTWTDAADAAGTATWFRLRKTTDLGTTNTTDVRLDGSCSMTGGGGDLVLDNTNIAAGQSVTVNSFTFTMPSGE